MSRPHRRRVRLPMMVTRLAACAIAAIGCGRIDFAGLDAAAATGDAAVDADTTPLSGVITIAGGGGSGSADGPGSQATFSNPVNLDFGPGGALFVMDYFNDEIRAIAPDLTVST